MNDTKESVTDALPEPDLLFFDDRLQSPMHGYTPTAVMQIIDTLRAQLAEAQRELIAKESERAGLELERNNAQRQHTMQCAINKADSQRILELTAQLAGAQRDSERINDLDVYVRLHPSQSVTLVAGNTSIRDHIDEIVAHWRTAIDAAKGEKNGA